VIEFAHVGEEVGKAFHKGDVRFIASGLFDEPDFSGYVLGRANDMGETGLSPTGDNGIVDGIGIRDDIAPIVVTQNGGNNF
jgi:hypothetical protein